MATTAVFTPSRHVSLCQTIRCTFFLETSICVVLVDALQSLVVCGKLVEKRKTLTKKESYTETLEVIDILSSTAKHAVPADRGQYYVSSLSQSTTRHDMSFAKNSRDEGTTQV